MLLIIGGFDPTSQAGILKDSIVAEQIGVPYRCCITTNTIQTDKTFTKQCPTDPGFFKDQLEALLTSTKFTGVKIGYLGDIRIAKVVYDLMQQYKPKNIVIDPVIVGKRADRVLVTDEFLDFYINKLFPLATLIKPNWNEACVLTKHLGYSMDVAFTEELMEEIAVIISDASKCSVVVTGKTIDNQSKDCLIDYKKQTVQWLKGTHFVFNKPMIGLGCRFSTAIAAYLSDKAKLMDALCVAKLRVEQHLESISPKRRSR